MAGYRANPFANAGNTITGTDFIGRADDLDAIENRVIRPLNQRGSIAIIGMPKIGKRSLVQTALMERTGELTARKLLPIWISMSDYAQASDIFRDLVMECKERLEQHKWINNGIRRAFKTYQDDSLSSNRSITNIARFFTKVREAGVWPIFVLDKFDHARTLFAHDALHYQWLRDLANNPKVQVTWVILSRRTLYEIETHLQSLSAELISSLYGIVSEHHLLLFDQSKDLPTYYRSLAESGVYLDQGQKNEVAHYCGNHPYLLATLGCQLIDLYGNRDKEIDIDWAAQKVGLQFTSYYEKITKFLQENGKLEKLYQILFGPVYDIKQEDIDAMQRTYGLIQKNPDWQPEQPGSRAAYRAFSRHFQDYLRTTMNRNTLWPLLAQTEQALQQLLTTEWHKGSLPQLGEHDIKGSAGHLLSMILYHWDLFHTTFRADSDTDKQYWYHGAALLYRVNQPLTQLRIDSHDSHIPSDYTTASKYCQQILQRLSSHSTTGPHPNAPAAAAPEVLISSHTMLPGDLLWNQYEVKELAGSSNHSQVLKVWDRGWGRFFAAKILYRDGGRNDAYTDQFNQILQREARILYDLDHQHIGKVYNLNLNPTGLVMQWIEGKALQHYLDAHSYLSPSHIIAIGMKLADALSYIHARDIVHRDLKPSNVILTLDGEPMLIDFDIARAAALGTISVQRDDYMGTPDYSAPEQFDHPEEVGPPADIFALGMILYEAATGGEQRAENNPRLHSGRIPRPEQHGIPRPFYELLCRMLAQQPKSRPNAQEVQQELQKIYEYTVWNTPK
ncbi:MAG TPA: protein kinase [Ktedonobacteraceae bacterium]|nr:protein kinase [Ktedonobacteraceae bacterium]